MDTRDAYAKQAAARQEDARVAANRNLAFLDAAQIVERIAASKRRGSETWKALQAAAESIRSRVST